VFGATSGTRFHMYTLRKFQTRPVLLNLVRVVKTGVRRIQYNVWRCLRLCSPTTNIQVAQAAVEPHVSIGCQQLRAVHERMTLANCSVVEKQGGWLTVGETGRIFIVRRVPAGTARGRAAAIAAVGKAAATASPEWKWPQRGPALGSREPRPVAAGRARRADRRAPRTGPDEALPSRKGHTSHSGTSCVPMRRCRSLSARHRSVGGSRSPVDPASPGLVHYKRR